MAPNIPPQPLCERRTTYTDAELYLLHSTNPPSACVFDDYTSSNLTFGDGPTSMITPFTDAAKHNTLPCCTQAFCELDMHPTIDPNLSNACIDASACFDFACLDETCLEYATTPCNEPGCAEPTTTECNDPHCEETSNCLECLDEHQPETCTTCCMSDICPNPAHAHLPKHHHVPNGYVPWYPQSHFGHMPSICSSERSSVEPRLSAALQSSSLSYESSPILTDARSTPAFDAISLGTPRGGHRRLQGASARQIDGTFQCHWIIEPSTDMTCGHVFTDAKGLHEHIQTTHFAGSASNHPCHWHGCDSGTFNTKPKLARHLHSHTEYKPHKCEHPGCNLTFVTQQQRDVHMKRHTGDKPFACKVCGKAFAYMDLLKSHMRSGVHGQADKKFLCSICGEGFSDSSNRTKHTKSVHDPITGVPCPEPGCGYVDTRREKLRTHCEHSGHALELISNSREWDEYFNREQALRRPHKGHKKKRSAAQAGFDLL